MKKNRIFSLAVLFILSLLILAPATSEAQFVAIARKIKNLSSGDKDVATVIMDAGASKVYAAAVDTVTAHKKFRITKKENSTRHLEFSNGESTITIQVDSLQSKLSQITVLAVQEGSASKSATQSATNTILAICRKLNLQCSTKD